MKKMTAPQSGVKVRMYRQGLGDFFLLAFPSEGGKPFYLVIDCGVLIGGEVDRMRACVADLADATGGRIDLLVATHQHWDHLSGFHQARDLFEQIEVGEVWVAWTEDPTNELAGRLRERRRAHLNALRMAVQGFRAAGNDDRAGALESVLGFFGSPEEVLGADGKKVSGIEAALQYVLGRGKPPRYRSPAEAVDLRGVPGVRVYVLGPPQDEKLLLRSDPSKKASEVYEKRLGLDEQTAFFAAVNAAAGTPATDEELEIRNLSFPFDVTYRVAPEKAKRDPFFRKHYYKDVDARRIDDDWLGSAENLALQLDSDTNNTSLALAIELSPGGKVLLFPGDAQVGNWLSWHGEDMKWPRPDDPNRPITAADLLRRTVLYKVGHHASHNATLREKGLELMESPELVALIPVDEAMAHRPKGGNPEGWDMPFGPLRERLEQKTQGRVLRADLGVPEKPAGVAKEEWDEFVGRCRAEELYLEIVVPD
ncbi:MAG: hypothetical protein ACJ75H_13765 [Thermoanaerobaculia bacterium]